MHVVLFVKIDVVKIYLTSCNRIEFIHSYNTVHGNIRFIENTFCMKHRPHITCIDKGISNK